MESSTIWERISYHNDSFGSAEWFDKEEFISKVMRNLKKETRFTISDFEDFNNKTPVIVVNLESNIIQ